MIIVTLTSSHYQAIEGKVWTVPPSYDMSSFMFNSVPMSHTVVGFIQKLKNHLKVFLLNFCVCCQAVIRKEMGGTSVQSSEYRHV